MGINIGAFLALLTCGITSQRVDWSLGFLAAGAGMILGVSRLLAEFTKFGDQGSRLTRWIIALLEVRTEQASAHYRGALAFIPVFPADQRRSRDDTSYSSVGWV